MKRKTRVARIPATAKINDLTSILLSPRILPRLISPQVFDLGLSEPPLLNPPADLLEKLASVSFQASLRALSLALSSLFRYRKPKRREVKNFSGTVMFLRLNTRPKRNRVSRQALSKLKHCQIGKRKLTILELLYQGWPSGQGQRRDRGTRSSRQ